MKPTVKEYIEKLKEALYNIANPLIYLKKEAEKQGGSLNGVIAMQLYDSASFLRGLADKALKETAPLEQQIQEESITEKCTCKKSEFTRMVDDDFNPLCGKCGKPI